MRLLDDVPCDASSAQWFFSSVSAHSALRAMLPRNSFFSASFFWFTESVPDERYVDVLLELIALQKIMGLRQWRQPLAHVAEAGLLRGCICLARLRSCTFAGRDYRSHRLSPMERPKQDMFAYLPSMLDSARPRAAPAEVQLERPNQDISSRLFDFKGYAHCRRPLLLQALRSLEDTWTRNSWF